MIRQSPWSFAWAPVSSTLIVERRRAITAKLRKPRREKKRAAYGPLKENFAGGARAPAAA